MAYVLPTPADLKLHFKAFAAVDDAVVQFNIDRAARSVDQTWTEGDYTTAIELLACHYLVLAGEGTGAEAEANANGLGGFSMIRSGQLTLQRGSGAGGGYGDDVPAPWNKTTYGQQYWYLLRQNRPRGAVAVSDYPYADGMYPPLGSPARFWLW